MLNVSLLTSDMWAVMNRIFAYHEKVGWMYFVAFAAVAVGFVIYTRKGLGEKMSTRRGGGKPFVAGTNSNPSPEGKNASKDSSLKEDQPSHGGVAGISLDSEKPMKFLYLRAGDWKGDEKLDAFENEKLFLKSLADGRLHSTVRGRMLLPAAA